MSAEPRADTRGAAVRLPPPLLYAVPLLSLWLVKRAEPLTIPGRRPAITWAGSLLALAGVGTSGWGALTSA